MKIAALAGGVGGAKLVHGLAQILNPEDLSVIVNTGDDFLHLGLHVCPDLDTVCYTLAGIANPKTGWGRADETWNSIEAIETLGGPTWFRLGDKDLATHMERTRRIHAGQSLSDITRDFCRAWGIKQVVLPMSNESVRTIVETDEGELPFQEYFVQRGCEPRVKGFQFRGSGAAQPTLGVIIAIEQADVVVICPSNPWVSIDPILSVPGVRSAIQSKRVIAVSPIIGGQAVKGPAAKMFTELGIDSSALSVARHYVGLISGLVLDNLDKTLEQQIQALDVRTLVTNTLMRNIKDRRRLGQDVLDFAGSTNQ